MKGVFLVKMIILANVFAFPSDRDGLKIQNKKDKIVRTQRNLLQFNNMIACATSRTSADYIDYGCYCGLGGAGTPTDATDRCCKIHDECYGHIQKQNLCYFKVDVYMRMYTRDNNCTGCADKEGTCERAVCECDGAAARCFAGKAYNIKHYNWPADKC
ncbi:basic phospholipase A2-like [Stylophora pistillata]|uniref:basic phospholipase A2-like n=1 Tax=Stylophora pistillata TaxID=50429 RepID=UPI000C050AFF|nr:basic phospholipase A2-like [Stylophora pistillata]XP_022779174.1 basic phospholipase A2-like [Stylophora pistillata]